MVVSEPFALGFLYFLFSSKSSFLGNKIQSSLKSSFPLCTSRAFHPEVYLELNKLKGEGPLQMDR